MLLRIGYFEGFSGFNAILFSGDVESLKLLADALRGLESPTATPIEIHRLPFCQCYGNVQITAHPISKELGARRLAEAHSHFSWQHSDEGWLEAAEKIDALISRESGHQYLSCVGIEDATIIVSLGEHDDRWWDRYGAETGSG
jgi:hypothetical protein